MIDQFFVLALVLIALRVAVGLAASRNMWRWIIAYWAVLTLKNAAAWIMEVISW